VVKSGIDELAAFVYQVSAGASLFHPCHAAALEVATQYGSAVATVNYYISRQS